MRRTFSAFFPLALWAAAVLGIGSLDMGSTSLPTGADKVGHFVMYGIGGAMAAWSGRKQGSAAAAWIALLLVVLTGAVDEVRQYNMPSRSGEIMDFVADTAGAVLAFVAADRLLKKGPEDG